jgi:hypothetical protein
MSSPLALFLPFILAATMVPADKEYEFLILIAFCLVGLSVSLYLMVYFPDLGVVIAECNQF